MMKWRAHRGPLQRARIRWRRWDGPLGALLARGMRAKARSPAECAILTAGASFARPRLPPGPRPVRPRRSRKRESVHAIFCGSLRLLVARRARFEALWSLRPGPEGTHDFVGSTRKDPFQTTRDAHLKGLSRMLTRCHERDGKRRRENPLKLGTDRCTVINQERSDPLSGKLTYNSFSSKVTLFTTV